MTSEEHALDPEVPQYYPPGESDSGFTCPLPLCSAACKAGADAAYLDTSLVCAATKRSTMVCVGIKSEPIWKAKTEHESILRNEYRTRLSWCDYPTFVLLAAR